VKVANNGDLDASNILIQEDIQSGFKHLESIATHGTYNHITGEWKIDSLEMNSMAELVIKLEVLDSGSYQNMAFLRSSIPSDDNENDDMSVVQLDPLCLKVFNQFSPNGDGMNDLFAINCIQNFPNNRLQIFNRHGNKVFEVSGYNNTWNGTSNTGFSVGDNNKIPNGTYFYVLDLGNGSPLMEGWIQVIR